jgi:hypothetical protein
MEQGESEFVLDQFRSCWGWPLREGLTTMPEVFDLNWSHCHVWASHPTALLSKHVLGLSPKFGEGRNHFTLNLIPGNLERASGKVPLINSSGTVEIAWQRTENDHITFVITSPDVIWVHLPGGSIQSVQGTSTLQLTRKNKGNEINLQNFA